MNTFRSAAAVTTYGENAAIGEKPCRNAAAVKASYVGRAARQFIYQHPRNLSRRPVRVGAK